MKTHSGRAAEAHHATGSNAGESRSTRGRGMPAVNARPPPAVPDRRYPSLSDDGQPRFPSVRRTRRNADERETMDAANENAGSRFFSVRVVACLLLVAIIAALGAKQ